MIAAIFLALALVTSPCEPPAGMGFSAYSLQSCLTDCYATFRPTTRPGDYGNCVQRCRDAYERPERRVLYPCKNQP